MKECSLCVEREVHCCDWCSCESHYSQQLTSLLTLKGPFKISLLTCLHLHINNLITHMSPPAHSQSHYSHVSTCTLTISLLTCLQLHINNLITHMFPPAHSQSHYSHVSTCTIPPVYLTVAVHKLCTLIHPLAITRYPVSAGRSWSVYSHVPTSTFPTFGN